MLVISRAPLRISFFGGGTDYPIYYERAAGAVLGTTIDKYVYASIGQPGNYFEHKIRLSYSKTELTSSLHQIEHPSVRECLKWKGINTNVDLHIFSDLPAKTGLGSSSSFTVGLLHALYALKNEIPSKELLAKEACHIEQVCIRENVGSQDPFHAALGGLNVIEFNEKTTLIRPIYLDQKKEKDLEDHLLLLYTGLTRYASETLKEQIERTSSRKNDLYLEQMYAMVFQGEKMLVNGSFEEMGRLLDKSWRLKKELSTKISTPSIDEAYEKALKAGAYGGKLCGAGQGGFLLLLVPPSHREKVKSVLHHLVEVPIRFEKEGSTLIYKKESSLCSML